MESSKKKEKKERKRKSDAGGNSDVGGMINESFLWGLSLHSQHQNLQFY